MLSKLQDEDLSQERRRRREEIEEKKRRIAESQKKANVQLRRDVSDEKKRDDTRAAGSPDEIEDLSEKRRSLLMMWESYAEGEGPGPENVKEEGKSQFGYDVMMMEAAQSDVSWDEVLSNPLYYLILLISESFSLKIAFRCFPLHRDSPI